MSKNLTCFTVSTLLTLLFVLSVRDIQSQTLPPNAKVVLTKKYSNWKQASISTGCSAEFRRPVVSADFDGNGKIDFVVTLATGTKGHLVALIAKGNSYTPFSIGTGSIADMKQTGFKIVKKNTKINLEEPGDAERTFILPQDAILTGTCESDDLVYLIFRNGKFSPVDEQ
jgi:hypothetical protein